MKQPLWILNSILIILIIAVLVFMFFSRQEIPERESLEIKPSEIAIKKEEHKISINKIYERDLFGTYEEEFIEPKEPELVTALPEPPTPLPVEIPTIPKPQFLEPLQITLKGIMVIGDDSKNTAIVLYNKTKQESSYKVGDTIEDAQLIRIFKNKVVFLRSNGQQEVFYLRDKDAEQDPAYSALESWQDSISQIDNTTYMITVSNFIKKISNLALFIDTLNMTMVYAKGKPVGVRIGNGEENTLAYALGLKTGDIVTAINNLSTTTTADRVKIYQSITQPTNDTPITIRFYRKNRLIELQYVLQVPKLSPRNQGSFLGESLKKNRDIFLEQQKIATRKELFNPTWQEMKKRERANILRHQQAHSTLSKSN